MIATILSWKNMLAGQRMRHIERRRKLEDQQKEIENQLEKLTIEDDKDGFLAWQIWEAELDCLKEFDDESFRGGYEP